MSQETNKRLVLAGFLIIIGIFLILRNFHLFPHIPWLFTWPMILVLIGTYILLSRQALVPALIFIGIGLYFLVPDVFGIYVDQFWNFWPLILIAIGMAILLRHRAPRYDAHHPGHRKHFREEFSMDYLDQVSIFSGGEKIITSKSFKGGKITNIFGGSEINMLNAGLSDGPNYIDVFTLFGGTTFIIPPTWNVKVDMVSIFGGFSDKRDYQSPDSEKDEPVLYIKGVTFFGGGEIKSHK